MNLQIQSMRKLLPYFKYLAIPLLLVGVWFFLRKNKKIEYPVIGEPNISFEKAKDIAEDQYNAMKNPLTQVDVLFTGLRGLNNSDLQMVYNAFGRKGYFMGVYWSILLGGDDMDLILWYYRELSKKDRKRMFAIWVETGLPNVQSLATYNSK